MLLPDVCLPVAYIGPKSRTERPRKTKIGIEVAHVTRDSDTTFSVNSLQLASSFQTLAENWLTFREKDMKPVLLFQRCSVLVQRFNAVLLYDSFPDRDLTDY